MEAKKYRWIQVVSSITINGSLVTLIGSTESEDRNSGLDILLDRHHSQMKNNKLVPIVTSVTFMNSSGEISGK